MIGPHELFVFYDFVTKGSHGTEGRRKAGYQISYLVAAENMMEGKRLADPKKPFAEELEEFRAQCEQLVQEWGKTQLIFVDHAAANRILASVSELHELWGKMRSAGEVKSLGPSDSSSFSNRSSGLLTKLFTSGGGSPS